MAVLLATLLVALLTGPYRLVLGSAVGSSAPDRPDPCLPGTAVPIMDSPHVAGAVAATVRYNSDPPTSGPHAAFAPPPGIYGDPLPDVLAVHALEHGHVVIQYGARVPASTVSELTHLAKVYADDTLLAPRPALGGEIALTAWGRIDRFPASASVRARVVTFIDRLRGRYNHGWTGPASCP